MKIEIPIVAITVHDITAYEPSEFRELLSDTDLIQDLTMGLDDIKPNQEVAYLLVLEDQEQKMLYPAYAKQYEVVITPKKERKKKVKVEYRKTAEYDYDSFEVQYDNEYPISIVVDATIN